ncbi:unnamed protein product [Bemisia tabaci]|uniref:Mos1 transposase HTH domain-containing protein n=1 Tax=Bemisia tabaci TaxID=7038 RepID=A0A9P0AJZ5_BEMTA|nr:unnamed protein product [Bemisia tabaci]
MLAFLLCLVFALISAVYTLAKRIDILTRYLEGGRNARAAAAAFNQADPGKNVRHTYVLELFSKFPQTGSVGRKPESGPQPREELTDLVILGERTLSPRRSLRVLEDDLDNSTSRATIHRIFKKCEIKPYKMRILHALGDGDPDQRLQFSGHMTAWLSEDPNILDKICWSDESCFFFFGRPSQHPKHSILV